MKPFMDGTEPVFDIIGECIRPVEIFEPQPYAAPEQALAVVDFLQTNPLGFVDPCSSIQKQMVEFSMPFQDNSAKCIHYPTDGRHTKQSVDTILEA